MAYLKTAGLPMDILLVEDNSSDAYLLQEVFARKEAAPGIHWVTDGHHAMDYLYKRNDYQQAPRPDLILLDLKLPRISGMDVLKEVKSIPELAAIPVIILATALDPVDHTQCKSLGADICLSKPRGLKEYESMVQRLISWASLSLQHEQKKTIN